MPSSEHGGHQAHVVHMYAFRQNTHKVKLKEIKVLLSLTVWSQPGLHYIPFLKDKQTQKQTKQETNFPKPK